MAKLTRNQEEIRLKSMEVMKNYYGEWWKDANSQLICVPPCRDFDVRGGEIAFPFQGPTDKLASNYNEEVIKKRQNDIAGREAESLVLAALQKCGLKNCILINSIKSEQVLKLIRDNPATAIKNYPIGDMLMRKRSEWMKTKKEGNISLQFIQITLKRFTQMQS